MFLTTKPNLQNWLLEKTYSNLIGSIERVLSVVLDENWNPQKVWKTTQFFCGQFARFSQKLFIKRASFFRFYYRNPNLKLDLQRQRTIFSLITLKISLNIQKDMFVCRSGLETTILASFLSKNLIHTVINLYLQNLSKFTIAKLPTSARTHITFPTSLKKLRALTMCSTFTPDGWYDTSNIKHIGKVFFVRIQCVSIYFACTKRLSNLPTKRLLMSAMGVLVSGAQYFLWRTNKFVFLIVWHRDLCFWRGKNFISRFYQRCLLS